MIDAYEEFLATKVPRAQQVGIAPIRFPDHLFGFQKRVLEFLLRRGRASAFLETGFGKSCIQLEWCEQTRLASNGRALLITPLSVAEQMLGEAQRFGYPARVITEQNQAIQGINICNYDRLHLLDPKAFGAVSLDESSILKALDGKTAKALISSFADTRFRLCATATPAPNDYRELGNHAEFLGIMSTSEMMTRWFINDSNDTKTWKLKGHAIKAFWDWVATWAIALYGPEDLGDEGAQFVLPELKVIKHKVSGDTRKPLDGLFAQDVSATTIHTIKRQTADARAEAAAKTVLAEAGPWLLWCDTDYEADAIHAALPGCGEYRGSMSREKKRAAVVAFLDQSVPVLIGKPSSLGFGLNFQHCHNMIHVGRKFSFEEWFQSVRRCWRFGQRHVVSDHLMVAEGEDQIGRAIEIKQAAFTEMKTAMRAARLREAGQERKTMLFYEARHKAEMPKWLTA